MTDGEWFRGTFFRGVCEQVAEPHDLKAMNVQFNSEKSASSEGRSNTGPKSTRQSLGVFSRLRNPDLAEQA